MGRGFERVVKEQVKCMRITDLLHSIKDPEDFYNDFIMILIQLSRTQQPRCVYTEDIDSCIHAGLGFYRTGNKRTKSKNRLRYWQGGSEMMDHGIKAGEGRIARKQ